MFGLFIGDKAEHYRQKMQGSAPPDSAIAHYLASPFIDRSTSAHELEYLALDFETTGLNAKQEAILSVGYTLIKNGRILLGKSGHHILRTNIKIPPESVIIHGITDDRARQGEPMHEVMDKLFHLMTGRVLLVHYAGVEQAFLNAYCRRQYGFDLPTRLVDTLEIEMQQYRLRGRAPAANQLRLFNLRTQYGLPRYQAHDAMIDAIATAELFLAQLAHKSKPILKDLM
jgi:DNA polymerase-3 subunit epsilon